MKIIAVVGSGSGCGKTTVVCRILNAISGLGAVKISPREGQNSVEWGAGEPGKDTALYVDSGAVLVARIIGPRDGVGATWERIRGQFEMCRGVVFEGASALAIPGSRFSIFILDQSKDGLREDRNRAIIENSTMIIDRSSHIDDQALIDSVRVFLADSSNR